MKGRRHSYRKIAGEIECFHRSMHGICLPYAEPTDVNLDKIKDYIKEKINAFGLIEVSQKEARIVCIGFVQEQDDEGYYICGVKCFLTPYPNYEIMYCGICGDVNRVNLMQIPHITFFCK